MTLLVEKMHGNLCPKPLMSVAHTVSMERLTSVKFRHAQLMSLQRFSTHAVRASARGKSEQVVQEVMELRAELEMARQEASAVPQLQAEIRARTAAMENLQIQLDKVEAIRAEELAASGSRFRQLEAALSEAEKEISEARNEASVALHKSEQLRQAALDELKASAELLERVNMLLKSFQKSEVPSAAASEASITESDVEGLLDVLEAAQHENASLRKQLTALAAAGDESASASGELGEALSKELVAARAAAAEAKAEVEGLKKRLSILEADNGDNKDLIDTAARQAAIAEGVALLHSTLDMTLKSTTPESI